MRSLMRHRFIQALGDCSGVAAVEFAFVAPILLLLWLGGVEITQALSADRRVSALTASIGDLVSRSEMVTQAEVENIFDLAAGALYPFDAAAADLVLMAADIDAEGRAKVAWSRSRGGTAAYQPGADVTHLFDPKMLVPDTQLIVPEVHYSYTPAVGYVITGSLALQERLVFVPRIGKRVALCKDAGKTDCV